MIDYRDDALNYLKDKASSNDISMLKYCAKNNIDREKALKRLHEIMNSPIDDTVFTEHDKNEAAKALYEVTSKRTDDYKYVAKRAVANDL
jgi:transcriptional regulator